jgi:hypothetical protein
MNDPRSIAWRNRCAADRELTEVIKKADVSDTALGGPGRGWAYRLTWLANRRRRPRLLGRL